MTSDAITGLVLAGGRGSRMGGVDKGLQNHHGLPLALHALRRLAPQVQSVMLNANRNLAQYAAMGVPVWPDEPADFAGPLAGFVAGLRHCPSAWMVTVPCDSPAFPVDLVARLAAAVQREQADLAVPRTLDAGVEQVQPVFCLMRRELLHDLTGFMAAGQRKIELWTRQHRCAQVLFDHPGDGPAFFNANTLADLHP